MLTVFCLLQEMVAHCGSELVSARYIQPKDDILKALEIFYSSINSLMERALEYLSTHAATTGVRSGDG
jgi:hypothetical protein